MATWDKDRPDGSEAFNLGDDKIRDNFDYLEQALQTVSSFANNPSDPTDIALTGGNARINVGTTRPTTSTAEETGIVFYDTADGTMEICTNGVGNTWVNITQLVSAVTMASTLAVTGALTASGIINANAGIHIPTTKTIEGTSGEDFLANEVEAINPMVHGSRHDVGGDDEIGGFQIGQVLQSSVGTTTRLTTTYQTLQTQAWTPSAPSGTAKCLVFVETRQKASDWATTTSYVTIRVQVNGVTKGGEIEQKINAGAENNPCGISHLVYAASVATGGSIDVTLQAKASGNGVYDIGEGRIVLIDLGQD